MGDNQWPPKYELKGGPKTKPGEKFQTGLFQTRGGGSGGDAFGDELVVDGDFTVGTGWTADTGWAIGSGVATATATGAAAYLHRAVTVVVGQNYMITYTITAYTSGNVAWSMSNGLTGTTRAATGTFSETFTLLSAAAELRFGRVSVDATLSIDNVSLRRMGPT